MLIGESAGRTFEKSKAKHGVTDHKKHQRPSREVLAVIGVPPPIFGLGGHNARRDIVDGYSCDR